MFLIHLSALAAEPVPIIVTSFVKIPITALTRKSIGKFDGPEPMVMPGIVDSSGRFYFRCNDFDLVMLSMDFGSAKQSIKLTEGAFYSVAYSIAGGKVVGSVGGYIWINAVDGKLVNTEIPLDKKLRFTAAFDNVLVFRTESTVVQYVVYLVNADGTAQRMENDEALTYLAGNIADVSVREGVLFYRSNILDRKLHFHQIDDDGNFYSSRTVIINSEPKYTIALIKDNESNLLTSFFDNEGNIWAMDFTKDEKQSLVLLYSGRDWGYRESPKKAVTTAAGLRIRLRASTDAFVLGSLGKDEAITILKTGETATIGGITAPWYRIKKADGLIGWAFGGYIKVVE
ncbi:MAG: SH3 domain-containing protein [Spirochaetia bacterium]|nr:SH3 domain-containing protein [Spirochaetia bacterium]